MISLLLWQNKTFFADKPLPDILIHGLKVDFEHALMNPMNAFKWNSRFLLNLGFNAREISTLAIIVNRSDAADIRCSGLRSPTGGCVKWEELAAIMNVKRDVFIKWLSSENVSRRVLSFQQQKKSDDTVSDWLSRMSVGAIPYCLVPEWNSMAEAQIFTLGFFLSSVFGGLK